MALTDFVPAPEPCRCSVSRTLDTLPQDDRDKLSYWLNDTVIPATQLSRHLASNGLNVSGDSIRRWRNGDCSCKAAHGAH